MALVLRSIIQCPHCGFKVTERLSAANCVLQYVCPACGQTVNAAPDRCVYCSYASVGCPSAQTSGVCCAQGAGAITKA